MMVEALIKAVKKHEVLYKRSSFGYSNKSKRAAAWNSIAEQLNVPENICRARWKTLRDQFVKKHAESHHASESGAEVEENQWQYYHQMKFLREHIKPRKMVTNLTSPQTKHEKNPDESSADASFCTLLQEDRSQSIESLADAKSFLDVDPFSEDVPPVDSRKRQRRDTESELLIEMTKIGENRSSQRGRGAHEGFFSMVREIFDDLPSDAVWNAKFFFINYLRDQVVPTENNRLF